MLRYTVKHGFHHGVNDDGSAKYFTRENEGEVKELPRAVRDELIALGAIEEHDERSSAPQPAAPAHTTGKEK